MRVPGGNLADVADDGKVPIRMTADRILALPSTELGEQKSRSGILIPATANRDRSSWGMNAVIASRPAVSSRIGT